MADDKSSIFTEKATNKLRSPDDLDVYVRATNPSVWVVVAAWACLLIGLFTWGFLGSSETNVGAYATYTKGEVVCFLSADKASKIHVGDSVNVGGSLMEVESISVVPLSRAEAREVVGSDYLANTIVEDEWTYLVRLSGTSNSGFQEGIPISASFTTGKVAPISLLVKDIT